MGGGLCTWYPWLASTSADAVDGFPYHVEQAALYRISLGHLDLHACGNYFHAPLKAIRGIHGNGPDGVFPCVLLTLHNEFFSTLSLDFKCLMYAGKIFTVFFKTYIHHRANYL
jgi:hypothetical protein